MSIRVSHCYEALDIIAAHPLEIHERFFGKIYHLKYSKREIRLIRFYLTFYFTMFQFSYFKNIVLMIDF